MASWNKLSRANPKFLKRLQDYKLHALVRYQLPYSPFYSRWFKDNNLSFKGIKSLEDLKKLSVISKEDIAPSRENPKKFMDFVLQPNKELIRGHLPKYRFLNPNLKKALEWEYKPIHLHFTTGRTAAPTPFLYTAYDLEKLKEAGVRLMEMARASGEEKAVNIFPYAPHLAFWQTYYALISSGIFGLNTGGGKIMGTEKIIHSIESMKSTLLIGMPGYIYYLLDKAVEQKKDFSRVAKIVLGAERIPEGLQEKLKELLHKLKARQAEILSTYAFTEGKVAWIQCCEESSYHLYPDMEYIEILDKNNEPVGEGEKGEIVYTALDFRGTVVLRYKTGDIGRLETGACPYCSRTVPRIGPDIERSSEFKEFNLTKVKGTLVNLNAFFPLLMAEKNVSEWQVEIRKKDNKKFGLDEMILYIAVKSRKGLGAYKSSLARKIEATIEVSPYIMVMDKRKLAEKLGMETELKEKRIIDLRK